MSRPAYEVLSGFSLLLLFAPLAFIGLFAAGIAMFLVAGLELLGDADWLLGGSLDSVRLLYDPGLDFDVEDFASDPVLAQERVMALVASSPLALFVSAWVQNLAMVGAAAGLLFVELPVRRWVAQPAAPWSTVWREGLAVRAAPRRLVVTGLAAGLTVMWLPSFLVQFVDTYIMSLDDSSAAMLGDAIAGAGPWTLAFGAFTIALLVPLMEELLFRGFLWSLMERWAPPVVPLIVTTVVFALFHVSSAHILGVLLIGFVAGWLRMHSGSVWPSVALHVVNNGLAVGLMLLGSESSEEPSLLVLAGPAFAGGLATLGLIVLTWKWRKTIASR